MRRKECRGGRRNGAGASSKRGLDDPSVGEKKLKKQNKKEDIDPT